MHNVFIHSPAVEMQVDLSHSEVQIRWELSRVVGKSALPPGVLASKGYVLLGCLQLVQCPSYPADSEPKKKSVMRGHSHTDQFILKEC